MSRRRSLSTAVKPGDQGISMQPPHSPTIQTSEEEVVEKYTSLKRRYHELQEETTPEFERSGDRNVKMREERSVLLEKITSLESEHPGIQSVASSLQQGPSLTTQSLANGQPDETNDRRPNVTTTRVVANSSTSGNGTQGNGTFFDGSASSNQQPQPDSSTRSSIANGAASSGYIYQSENIASSSQSPASGSTRTTRRSSRIIGNGGDVTETEPMPKTRTLKRKAASPVVKTRATRGDSAAATLAAAAVQAAHAEEASSSNSGLFATATTLSSSIQPPAPPDRPPSRETVTPSSSSGSIIDPSLAVTSHNGANPPVNAPLPIEHSNIENFAKAAVAAQNAAEKSEAGSATSSTVASPSPSNPSASAANPSSVSPSSASYNPYSHLKLATPLSMNPYALYYPPGTPVTPGNSPYSPYGNPYYYMSSPVAGPSGVYPPGPGFSPVPNGQRPPEAQHQPKPKRLKAHTVTSKSFSIPVVPRDNKTGKPMLPLNVGIMTVISLGDVCMREHFHTERYIFPVGYEVTRRYLSTVDPNVEVVYHCTILDGGDGPKFQIVPSDVPGRPVIAGTATGAWSSIVKQANQIRNRQHSNSVSGPDFFGLGQNTIKHLIQELPNADRLRDYVWQTFVEGGPLGGRHAAVIPALPEEYDSSMPIGAYYPTERDKRKRNIPGAPGPTVPKGISHYPQHIIAQAERQQQVLQHLPTPGEPLGTNLPPGSVPQIDTSLIGLQPMQNADGTSQPVDGPSTGMATSLGTGPITVPPTATIVSIMNAYSASAGSSAPTPTE